MNWWQSDQLVRITKILL